MIDDICDVTPKLKFLTNTNITIDMLKDKKHLDNKGFVSKHLIKNLEKKLLLLCAYISDVNSKYFNPNTYDDIAEDISNFCDDNTPLILIGDMNSRTRNLSENYIEPDLGQNCCIETRRSSIDLPIRKNCDCNINNQGK